MKSRTLVYPGDYGPIHVFQIYHIQTAFDDNGCSHEYQCDMGYMEGCVYVQFVKAGLTDHN